MKRKHFSEEQIIGILNEAAAGATAVEVCRQHGVSETTYYRWKAKFGGLAVSDARRLRQLEAENSRLKRLLAEAHLDNAVLKDLLAQTGDARSSAAGSEAPGRGAALQGATRLRLGRPRPLGRPLSRAVPQRCRAAGPIRELAGQHRRFGYLRLHALLRREGLVINRKKTYRLYRTGGPGGASTPATPPAGA